ncbi:MAG: hypothetical protein ACP5SP_06560, partial [Caldisericum sp.]|uniref:hypothetical protein n=1 Tax=Caldisericum sp. TaxID=2499687 RepID=UPI003D0F5125
VNKGSISPTTTANFVNGVLCNFPVIISGANTGVIITVTDSVSAKTGVSNSFDVSAAPPPTLTLIQPVGGESVTAGSTYPIQFSVSGDTSLLSYFALYLTVDGGASYERIGYVSFVNGQTSYTYSWSVPTRITSLAKVIVYARRVDATTLAYDISHSFFTITDAQHPAGFAVNITNPTPSSVVTPDTDLTINWTTSGTTPFDLSYYALYISYEAGRMGSWQRLGYALSSVTSFTFHVPAGVRSDKVMILVYPRNASAGTVGSTSPVTFTIAPPSYNFTITINHPTTGDTLTANTTYTINTTIANLPPQFDHYTYYLSMDNGASWESLTVNPGLTFTVPYRISTNCKLMIIAYDASNNVLGIQISGTFTIAP